jgi:hypothetical protein
MAWRDTARFCGAALAVVSVSTVARPASAQDIERVLAGIRLGSRSGSVLAKFGNPNEVVIGDVGIRAVNTPGQQGQAGQGGPGGFGGGRDDGSGGLPGVSGAPGFPGAPGGVGAFGMPGNIPGGPGGGPPGGFGGPPAGFGGGPPGGFSGPPAGFGGGPPGGFPGAPGGSPYGSGGGIGSPEDGPGGPGGAGASVGAFGNTQSTLARQQEVTWIYNRKVGNNVVSYEFLIGPSGNVSQITVTGYSGGGVKTKRGVGLGATYKDVVRAYGYPEEHFQIGRVLVADYRKRAHARFQFYTQPGQANPLAGGNKVIGITIATVE